MDVTKSNINSILEGTKQFIIPVYQRTYSWRREQCERLWNDIIYMQKHNKHGHFVGSIVNIAEVIMPSGVQKYMIIDGQQRMTTLTLLLLALRDYRYEKQDEEGVNPDEINMSFIINQFKRGNDKYKLLLTQGDRDALIKIIERYDLQEINNCKILENYRFFLEKIKFSEITPEEVYEGIAKLQIVNITLERGKDDPQLIFESLNSTGVDLSQSDLIRNYILMGLDEEKQNSIYEKYWFEMEKFFGGENQSWLMDKFFKDYLTLKNGRTPKLNKIYEEFKEYHHKKVDASIEEFCEELYKNGKYYNKIYFVKSGDYDIDLILRDIKALQMEVSYPFLLKVYKDYEAGVINKEEIIEILKICESYVFRRNICGIPTNSLNKTFATICNKIDESNYLSSIKYFFNYLDSYKEFPSDESFEENLKFKDIYNMRIRNYILSKLENFNNKAPINIDNYTIEHIMPQNKSLGEEWKRDLGDRWKDVQKKYLHTIGNLTLTAYNSEMSDKPFKDKLEMRGGFKESALRINNYLVNQNEWNEDKILERASELCELSKRIWAYPVINEEEIVVFSEEEKDNTYDLDSYEYLSDNTRLLYEALDKRILNISSDVKREYTKLYIAYKVETNFVDVIPKKSRLRLVINMKYDEIIDPKGLCSDLSNKGHWGNGECLVYYSSIEELDDIMELINQSYEKQILD